jgi:light-regulated signal transduction histidine kinase (bacteriophytochrome)
MEKHHFEKIIKSLSSGVILQDTDLNILFCNDSAATLLGLTKDQLLGKTSYDPYWQCFFEDGTPYKVADMPPAKVLATQMPCDASIMGVRKPDNSITWINVKAEPIFKSKEKALEYIVVTYTDVTELKNKESQLEESNAELERFAYVASHDLQEPLRKINTFLNMFLSKMETNIDDKNRTYLDKVLDSTRRMSNLINDLLEFSRVSRVTDSMEDVNCNDKINYIRDAYNLSPTDKKVIIKSDNLPNIKGYKTQILSLFQNLIGNGLKYNQSEVPEINVSCTESNTHHTFSIKDNGIGIEQEEYDKIFLPFHRLHGKSEYSGSGIGLATCKKIVEKHKGTIWLTSERGKGTNFYFSIPK